MKSGMRAVTAMFAGVLVVVCGCRSTPIRHPVEESLTDPGYADAAVADVVVLPVRSGRVVVEDRFPATDMREMMRAYLIQEKDYAVPRAEWVDVAIAEGKAESALETDALLEVSVDQWDSTALTSRGVIYATASFELRSGADGRALWTYRCEDLQIPVESPVGMSRETTSPMAAAARKLTVAALSRLPRK